MSATTHPQNGTETPPPVTLDEIRHLATIPVWTPDFAKPSAAGVFGVARSHAYAMANRGDFPTIRLGNRVVVPVPMLLRMLGYEIDHHVSGQINNEEQQ